MNPGEYVSPLTRKTLVQCPVVSGYVTARLQAQDQIPMVSSGQPGAMMVTFQNIGNTQFSVVMNETSDRSVSGTRTKLTGFTGTAVSLVPGGQQTLLLQGYQPFVEVYCTGTTTGELIVQIDSQRRWTEMGFDKLDPFYPPQLWQAKEYPGPTT